MACEQIWNTAMPSSTPLQSEIHHYQRLKQRLLLQWPDLDDDSLQDTLEGITDLQTMIAAIVRSALIDEALQKGLRSRLDDMKARLARLGERATRKRELVLEAMTEAGLKKLEQPDFTASARVGAPAVLVTSEEDIPDPYWLAQPPKLDRQLLLADLKRGHDVQGAELGNARPVLSVRTK